MSHALGLCYGDISHAHVSMRDPFIDLLVCFKNPALSNLNTHPTINSNNLAGADIDLDASSDSGSVYGAAVTGDNIYQYYHNFCLAGLLPNSTSNPNNPTSTSASSIFSTSESTRSIVIVQTNELVPGHVRVCLFVSLDEAMVERLPEIVKFFLMALSDGDGMRLSDEGDGGASASASGGVSGGGGSASVWGNGGFKQVLKSVSGPKPYARNRFSANLPSDTSSALGSELNNPNTHTNTNTNTNTTTKTEKRYMILLPIYIPARLIASPDTNTNAGRRMSVRTMESLEMQCRARMVACLANVGGREWRRAHMELVEWCDRYATMRLPSGHNTLSRLTLSRLTLNNNNNDHDSHNANTLTRSKTLRHANAYPSLGRNTSMMSLNTRTERRGRTRSKRGVGSDSASLSQSVAGSAAGTVRTVGSIRAQLNEANLRVHNATNDREDIEEDLRKLKRRVSSRGTLVKAQSQLRSRSQSRVQPERQRQRQQEFQNQIQPQIYNIPIQLERTQIPGRGQMVLTEERQQQQLSANYIPNLDLGPGFDLGALASELVDAYAQQDLDFGLGQGGNVNNINNNGPVAYSTASLNANVDLGPNTSHDTYGYTSGGAVAGVDSIVYPSSNPVNHVAASGSGSGSGSGYNAYNNTYGNGYGTNYGTNFDNSGTSNLGNGFTGDFNNTFSTNCVNGNVSNNVNLNANNASYVSPGPVMSTNVTAASMIPTPTLLPAAPISDNLMIHAPAPVPAIYEIPGIFEQIAASQQQYHQQQQAPVTPPAPTSVPVQQQEITQAQYAVQSQSSAYESASYVPSPVALQAQDVFSLQAQEQQRLQEDILRQLEEFAQQSSSSASTGTLPLQTSMPMPTMLSTPSMSTMHPAPESTLIPPPLQSPIHLVSSPSTSSSSSFGFLPLPGGYPVVDSLDMSGIIDAGDGSGFISYASASSSGSGSGSGSALSSAYASPHSSASASGFDFLSAIDDASSAFNALASADEASTAGGQIQDDTMGAPKSRDFWQSVINFIPLKM